MEESARRFARNILLLHLALLVIVVLLVFFAGREVYQSTREQVLNQTGRRQRCWRTRRLAGSRALQRHFSDLACCNDLKNASTAPTTQLQRTSRSRCEGLLHEKPTAARRLPPL